LLRIPGSDTHGIPEVKPLEKGVITRFSRLVRTPGARRLMKTPIQAVAFLLLLAGLASSMGKQFNLLFETKQLPIALAP
jgi:hypothetical protein